MTRELAINIISGETLGTAEQTEEAVKMAIEALSEVKPITYQNCANAMMKMWIEKVVTAGEYNRIMDKLNKWYMSERKEV